MQSSKNPPPLHNGTFILNCADKAKLLNDFFSRQCKLLVNDSSIPVFEFLTNQRLEHFVFNEDDILSLVRNIDIDKA